MLQKLFVEPYVSANSRETTPACGWSGQFLNTRTPSQGRGREGSHNETAMRRLSGLVIFSLAFDALAFAIPFYCRASSEFGSALRLGYFCSLLGAGGTIWGLVHFGRRGLWLLFGLPLCFLWPLVDLLLWASCRFGGDCI